MKTMTMKTFLIAALVSAAGCDKKAADGKGSAKVGADPSKTAMAHVGKMPAAFASWDMAARHKAWQGAWAGDGGGLGNKAAWQIAGTQVTYVDSRGEKTYELAVDSPCTAKMVEKAADGSSSSTTSVYTLKDGQLVTGLGDAGQKKGDTAIVCGGGDVF